MSGATTDGHSGNEWRETRFAQEWAARDVLRDFLDLPRRIASTVVAGDGAPARVADIGSGPGDFLARFLQDFPDAQGIWSDVSEAMLPMARERLVRFGERVSYLIVPMEDLAAIPAGLDVLTTSRATHHLSPAELARFYAEAAGKLAPGGWLVNLDHTDLGPPWDARLKAARRALIPPPEQPAEHPHIHTRPRPSVEDHLSALGAAGLTDAATPWRSFQTCLFMARLAGS
jgi:SAM-dependent methyltransferase